MPDRTPTLTLDEIARGERLLAEVERLRATPWTTVAGYRRWRAACRRVDAWTSRHLPALLALAREAVLARVGDGRRER